MARSDATTTSATLTDQSGSDGEIPVKVDFIGNTVDDRTGTIELRATFDNPDLRLVPGELVDVGVNLQVLKQSLTVPREALNVGQNGNYVFVVDDATKAQLRPVTVAYQDQTIAALASGIKPGERVVTDGQLRLTPGVTVSITPPPGGAGSSTVPDATPQAGPPQAAAPQTGRQGPGRSGG
jgi:membrane fusion protein, multidrug efflux system